MFHPLAVVMQSPCGELETWEFQVRKAQGLWHVHHDGQPWVALRARNEAELTEQITARLLEAEEEESRNLEEADVFTAPLASMLREGRIALTIDQLMTQTSQFSKKKMNGCRANLFRTEPKFGRWTFRVRCSESYSSPAGHLTRIQLDPQFEGDKVAEADIFVSCSCPAWTYWGPDYNAKSKGYLEGPQRSNGQSPDVRDPGRRNLICKHVATAGKMFKGFIFPLVYRQRYKDYVEEVKQKRNPVRQPGTPTPLAPQKPEVSQRPEVPQRLQRPSQRPTPTVAPGERGRTYVAPEPSLEQPEDDTPNSPLNT